VKNIIQWKRGSSTLTHLDRMSLMRHDLEELKENERTLDALIDAMKETSKRQLLIENKHAYVKCHDLHNIDMYKDQMIMVVKAPSESQLILMDGDPPPVVLKSEKEEIDVFFCPDPSSDNGGLHPAAPDTSDDESFSNASVTTRKRSSRASRRAAAASLRKRNLGSAQRNLSKAFEEMTGGSRANAAAKSKSNLFGAFNATVKRERAATEDSDEAGKPSDGDGDENENEEDAECATTFKSTTTKDLTLLGEPADEIESLGIKRDVKLSLFTPQKNLLPPPTHSNGSETKWELAEMDSFSPSYIPQSDERFFPLEPEAEYNFLLAESEGVMDLFDYDI